MSGCESAPYHTFSVAVEGAPHSRQCASCGEVQVYNPPTGHGVVFDDVLIPNEVVEAAVAWAREMGGPAYDESEDWCQPIADLARYVEA